LISQPLLRKAIPLLFISFAALLATSCVTRPSRPDERTFDSPLLQFGYDRFLAGEFDDAADAFSALILLTSDPELQNEALYRRALSYIKLARFQDAEADLIAALDRTRSERLKADALRALGDALLAQGKFRLAVDAYSKVLARYPDQVPRDEVLYKLAVAHIRQGNGYEALPYLEDLSANFPDSLFAEIARDIAAHASTGMAVQFAVFSDRTAADVFTQNLRTKGVDPRIEPISREKKPLFAIRAGSYRNWQEATAAVAALRARNINSIVFP